MAESTLTLTYNEIRQELGYFLGYGRDDTEWTNEQGDNIEFAIQGGYRQFLNPPILEGEDKSHIWSFLSPIATLNLVSGTNDYDLPDNFGSIIGELTFDAPSLFNFVIQVVGEGRIRQMRSRDILSNFTSRPNLAAIRPKATTGSSPQRWEILIWPDPDSSYTLNYRYNVNPDKLSATQPYPLGGMQHSETILESCLAVAEKRYDDELGIHAVSFQERLRASVFYDRSNLFAETLGYNGDHSDGDEYIRYRTNRVSYSGEFF